VIITRRSVEQEPLLMLTDQPAELTLQSQNNLSK
jgi:hypothetical protein